MARQTYSQAELRRMVDRLRALAFDPPKQRAYALELLAAGVPPSLLPTVIDALGPPFDVETRLLFIAAYHELALKGGKVDPGGEVRARLVDGVAHNALSEDREFFRRVLAVREASMQLGLGPAVLHAAGLRGLQVVDPDNASIVATQLMSFYLVPQAPTDPRQMTMTPSGEPLVSALRVLFALGQDVSLFQWAVLDTLPSAAKGEAIRLLVNLSPEMTSWLVERFAAHEDDLVSAGALDLALARPDVAGSEDAVRWALKSDNTDILGYVAMSIAALRNPAWLKVLYGIAAAETKNRSRLVLYLEALRAVPGDSNAEELARELEARRMSLASQPAGQPNPASEEDDEFVY